MKTGGGRRRPSLLGDILAALPGDARAKCSQESNSGEKEFLCPQFQAVICNRREATVAGGWWLHFVQNQETDKYKLALSLLSPFYAVPRNSLCVCIVQVDLPTSHKLNQNSPLMGNLRRPSPHSGHVSLIILNITDFLKNREGCLPSFLSLPW